MEKIWEKYLPETVYLYCVDYQSTLEYDKKMIHDVIQRNNFYPITETIYDWWDNPEADYIQRMKDDMELDDIQWNHEWEDEIREALWDRDKSTPMDDLISNTGDVEMYYDLCDWFGGAWQYTTEEQEAQIDMICRLLQIPKNDKRRKKVDDLYSNSCDGGVLRIYFNCNIKDVVSSENKFDEHAADFRTIKFKGKYTVALHDQINGGGWSEEIYLDCTYEFKRSNLQYAHYGDRYDYESVYGCKIVADAPIFSMEDEKCADVPDSKSNSNIEREEKLTLIFKSGSCTLGDMDMRRHRDVYYRNDYFPCGWKCPHCGTFWID